MDRLISPGGSDQETDLTNPHDLESNKGNEDTHPSRPTSRLGFNRTVPSTASDAASGSEVAQWSRRLFQNVGISDLELLSIKPQMPIQQAVVVNSLGPSSTDDVLTSKGITVESPPSPSSEDTARLPASPRKSPSVSRLCFPFVTTPSPRRHTAPPPPPPPTRHKYSCFPSLMSPVTVARPSPKLQRHCYGQHGYSRNALQHVKWFWSLHEEDREGTEQNPKGVPQEHDIEFSTPFHPSPFLSSQIDPIQIDPMQQTMPPITVHPRRGDISALRDPYCTDIDRCFAGLPTWTIGKAIWMHDLHMADTKRNASIQDRDDEESGSDYGESEGELETSASTHFSDDSDATLVESENEYDPPVADASSKGKNKADKIQNSDGQLPSMDSIAGQSSSPFLSGRLILDRTSWSQAPNDVNPKSRNTAPLKPTWATNWYHRWEFLLDMARRDRAIFDGAALPLDISPSVLSTFSDTSGSAGPWGERVAPPLNVAQPPPSIPNDTSGPYGFVIGSSFNKDRDDDAWMARLETY